MTAKQGLDLVKTAFDQVKADLQVNILTSRVYMPRICMRDVLSENISNFYMQPGKLHVAVITTRLNLNGQTLGR